MEKMNLEYEKEFFDLFMKGMLLFDNGVDVEKMHISHKLFDYSENYWNLSKNNIYFDYKNIYLLGNLIKESD